MECWSGCRCCQGVLTYTTLILDQSATWNLQVFMKVGCIYEISCVVYAQLIISSGFFAVVIVAHCEQILRKCCEFHFMVALSVHDTFKVCLKVAGHVISVRN